LPGVAAIWPDRKARRPVSATLICDHPRDAISHIVLGLRRLTGADVLREGMRAVTLISKSKPESQLTPIAVQFGYGVFGNFSLFTAMTAPICFSGSVWNDVTSTISSNVHPPAASVASRLAKARRT